MNSGPDSEIRRDREDLGIALQCRGEPEGQRAIARLLSRYRERVYLWCFRYVRDPELAQEISQEVLLRAYQAFYRLEANARFDGWLFIIARNSCFKQLRRPSLSRDYDVDPDSVQGDGPRPDTLLEEKEAEEELLGLIRDRLDPLEQRVLALRCFERLPVETISRMLDLETRSGARALLQRARRKIRNALDKRNGE